MIEVRVPRGIEADAVLVFPESLVSRARHNPWILQPRDTYDDREPGGVSGVEVLQVQRALVEWDRTPWARIHYRFGNDWLHVWTHAIFTTPEGSWRTALLEDSRTRIFGPRATNRP